MRAVNRLTATAIRSISERGLYGDGYGLSLQVSAFGTKAWIFRYQRDGTPRMMGLGPVNTSSVAAARKSLSGARGRAQDAHELLLSGTDPIDARQTQRAKAQTERARVVTFKDAAERYIKAHRAGWKNPKHADQWPATLGNYAYPIIGNLPVTAIDTGLVMKCLEPIWQDKPETASRLRGRIESVLDWATVRGFRQGDNPARWRGHLAKLLPPRTKVRNVKHHPALPYADLPEFMAELRGQENISARALEFTILTAARTNEALAARWASGEFDLLNKIWNVPAERMGKTGRVHSVPLSDRTVELLTALPRIKGNDYVFAGGKRGKPLSGMAMDALLARMGYKDGKATVHGFRSTFRDWAGDCTNYPRDVAEAALAHTIQNDAEAAYRRGTAIEKRRRLMADWARYCSQKPKEKAERGKVVAMHEARA
jgi:integrase